MTPCPSHEQFQRFLAEELPPSERGNLESHIEACQQCQETLERLTGDSVLGRANNANPSAPPGLLQMRSGPQALPSSGSSDAVPTQAEHPPAAANDELPCALAPSSEPGSLGRLNEYEVLGIIGRGGMGVVLKGYDPLLRRVVAIKVLAPHLASETARKRFLREAQSAAAVTHENVVAIHGVRPGPPPYLVMQYVAGSTLEQHLQQAGPLSVPEVVRIGLQIAQGLAAAHAQGLIHRDIKPANILLESAELGARSEECSESSALRAPSSALGRVKITDFGLARAVDDASVTQSGVIVGTPMYMSPEQAEGRPLDHRSDLFSLGSVLYVACTRQPPFQAGSAVAVLKRVCEETPQPIREVNPDVPEGLAAVVMKLLAKAPSDRFQSASEVAGVLSRFLAEGVWPRIQLPAPPSRRRGFGRGRWLAAGVGLVLLGAAVPAFLALIPWHGHYKAPSRRPPPEQPLPPTFTNRLGMEFVLVPRGRSWLGGGSGTPGSAEVRLAYDFYLGKHEVTQEQWETVNGHNPSRFARGGHSKGQVARISDEELKRFPVEQVSRDDIQMFLDELNRLDQQAGWTYCLPIEAEWEYACRGGPLADRSQSAFDFYLERPANELRPDQANFGHDQKLGRTCKVGSYRPNALGLYDMHGNVAEWCDDAETKPNGFALQVTRGGSWEFGAAACRAARREKAPPVFRQPSLGLRLARVYVGAETAP